MEEIKENSEDNKEKSTIENTMEKVNLEDKFTPSLPKMVSEIREFIYSINSPLVRKHEVDLPDKYQIIIEIDKNA